MFYCIFILCPFLILWIRNNPCNPRHPQWCLVENFPIFFNVQHTFVPYVYEITWWRPSNTIIYQTNYFADLFIYLFTYLFIIYGLYNDPVSGFL